MNTFEILLLVLLIILIVGITALFFLLIRKENKGDKEKDLRLSISQDLLSFSRTIDQDFSLLNKNTADKLRDISDAVVSNINDTNKNSLEIYERLSKELSAVKENQVVLNELASSIASLQNVLQDKKSRGAFGEVELYSLLENAYGKDEHFYRRQYVLSNGARADAVLFGPQSLGMICIDSKFPLENFRRIYDGSLSQNEREKASRDFKNDVQRHIQAIADKYIIKGETADMAYLFLPGEAVFAEIYGRYPEVIDRSYEAKVYIVSPTTLMAYITAIKSIFLSLKKEERAETIEKELAALSVEFTRFKDRSENLQRDFEKIIPDFEKLAVTSGKLIRRFAAIEKGEGENDETVF